MTKTYSYCDVIKKKRVTTKQYRLDFPCDVTKQIYKSKFAKSRLSDHDSAATSASETMQCNAIKGRDPIIGRGDQPVTYPGFARRNVTSVVQLDHLSGHVHVLVDPSNRSRQLLLASARNTIVYYVINPGSDTTCTN